MSSASELHPSIDGCARGILNDATQGYVEEMRARLAECQRDGVDVDQVMHAVAKVDFKNGWGLGHWAAYQFDTEIGLGK